MSPASFGGGSPVRIGVVGLGAVARDVHLPLLRGLGEFEIAVLADPDGDAVARAAASLEGSVIRCTDPMAVCSGEATAIDAVLIASPTAFHAEQTSAAMRAGLHVYVEKPLAAHLDEGKELAALPLASGQVAQLGFNYRFDPAYSEMAQRIGAGEVGRVQEVSMTFRAPLDPGETWRRDDRAGGGVLLDLFSHDVDLLGVLGLRFAEVAATREGDAVTITGSLVDAEEGPARDVAHERVSFVGEYGYRSADEARCRLTTENGDLGYDRYRDLAPRWRPRGGGVASGLRNVARQVGSMGVLVERRRSPWRQPTYRRALRVFAEAVAHGRGGEVRRGAVRGATLADGLEALRVVDGARRSLADGGRPVLLSGAEEPRA